MAYGLINKGAAVNNLSAVALDGEGNPSNPNIKELPAGADVGAYDIDFGAGTFSTMNHLELINGHSYTISGDPAIKTAQEFIDEITAAAKADLCAVDWSSVALTHGKRAFIMFSATGLDYGQLDALWDDYPPTVPAST